MMRRSAFTSSVTLSRGFCIAVSGHTARYRRKAFVVRATASAFDLLAQAGAVLTSAAPIGEEEKRHLSRIVMDTTIAVGRDKAAAATEQAAAAREQAAAAREQAALIQRLHAAQMTTTRALHSAGVVDGRRLLEWLHKKDGGHKSRTKFWTDELIASPELLKCIDASTNWLRKGAKANQRNLAGDAGLVAKKIEAVHHSLHDNVHSFVPGAGLVIIDGVPNAMASAVLRCLCAHYGVPIMEMRQQEPASGVQVENG